MPRNFNLPVSLKGVRLRDPRFLVRAVIGLLLAANLVAAVIAFKPFGGSAEDLRRQQSALQDKLAALQTRVAATRKMVDKVQLARTQGDEFLAKYFMDLRTTSSQIDEELLKAAKDAGVKQLPTAYDHQQIEGSETLEMLCITEGLEGTYEALTKFINIVDKSPRFLIIEGMQTAAPQQNGKSLSIQIKIDTFARAEGGATS